MVLVSSAIVACMNIVILVIGMGFLVMKPIISCYALLYGPIMTLGALLVVQSLLGLLGICSRNLWLMWFYLFLKLMLILAIALGILLDGAIMTKGDVKLARNNPNGKKENQRNEYAQWLENYVVNAVGWLQVWQCLTKEDVCSVHDEKPHLFIPPSHHLFRQLRKGCCQPPRQCGSEQINGTDGKIAETRAMMKHLDCKAWANEGETKCYYCEACKAGFLENLVVLWRKLFPFIIILHLILILLFIVGCNVFRLFKAQHSQSQYTSLSAQL